MSIVGMTKPDYLSTSDWDYYLSCEPRDYVENISSGLKTENRFFVDERFQKLLYYYAFDLQSISQAQTVINQNSSPLYRSRIYKEKDAMERYTDPARWGAFQGYNKEKSFVPPDGKNVPSGRANPEKIRYLYATSDLETSVLETRARSGEFVSVACIQILESMHLIDLSKNYSAIDADTVSKSKWINRFILSLESAFQKPYAETGDYYLCQYICEYYKNWGMDGVMYRSAQKQMAQGREGICFTVFNYAKCDAVSSKLYYVCSNSVELDPPVENS